jgi:transposase
MRRNALREDQWERIKDLLPGREGHVGVTAKDNRPLVEAVLYRYRATPKWSYCCGLATHGSLIRVACTIRWPESPGSVSLSATISG